MVNESDVLEYAVGEGEDALLELHHWLAYGGLTFLGGAAAFWLPYTLIFSVLTILAVLFVPYMLWKLYVGGWHKAIWIFAIVVLIPLAASRLVASENFLLKFLLIAGPLIAFYTYTWILRLVLGEHLDELRAARLSDYERSRNAL